MLKIIHSGNTMPISMPVDPTAQFQAGMFCQLKLMGNDIVAGVSDGTAPYGIIDDVRTSAFTRPAVDEVVTVVLESGEYAPGPDGRLVTIVSKMALLESPNIVPASFTTTIEVNLSAVNGVVEIPVGTELNFDSDGDSVFDSIQIVVNYIFQISNMPGDDSTVGSGRITIWYARAMYATDQFDSLEIYPLNATLYVGLDGKVTTKQPTENHPGIAMVTGPPSSTNSTIEFILL